MWRCAHRRRSGTGVGGEPVSSQSAEAVLDGLAADHVLHAPPMDVLAAAQAGADAEVRHGEQVLYSAATESDFAATAVDGAPGDPTAATGVDDATLTGVTGDQGPRAALGGTTFSYPGAETADAGLSGTTAGADDAAAVNRLAPETAGSTREDGAVVDSPDLAADGEPSDVVVRPTNVTETLTATALIPEVRSAPAVWDADRLVTEIYLGEYKSLVRLAVLLVHDVQTAEEVVQDAFEAMHTAWRRLRDSEKALSYLRQAVVNRSRSVLRHRTVVDKNAPKPAPDEPSAEQAAMTLIERSAVIDALRMLPERQREAIVLRYYADLSETDIAATMGISKGAVKSHTARAMAALKSILEQETT